MTEATLSDILGTYQATDDVWKAADFLQFIFIQSTDKSSFADFLISNQITHAFVPTTFDINGIILPQETTVFPTASDCDLINGPYVASLSSCGCQSLNLSPVYEIHTDDYEAFMEGSYKKDSESGTHISLHISILGTRLPGIITPSRLSSTAPDALLLAGLRFAVKDIFHVKGMKTSGGSRAYYQSYGPQNYTTQVVQKSLDGGAEMIGKTRSVGFALSSPQNGRDVDFLDPWNSRGDGYQATGGSSSGSGAAVIAYDWIDFALGSDTGGSIRIPSRHGGLFGYKPSHGIFNITGILVAISEQDTPGFMTHSPELFSKLGRFWAKGTPLEQVPTKFLTNLQYLQDQFTPLTQPEAEAMKLEFFDKVASTFNMTTTTVNVTASWYENDVTEGLNESITGYMYYVYSDQNSVELWNEVGAQLAELYASNNNGAFPPSDPAVNLSWTDGVNATTIARYPQSAQRRLNFAEWYNTHIIPSSNETCTQSIIAHSIHILPYEEKVQYYPVTLAVPGYWDCVSVSVNYAGVPEIVVPIGQIEFWSPYSRKIEMQPMTVAFQAAKGCDLVLFELVDRLREVGLIKEVMSGKLAFP
jgi:hypothetical protein